MTPQEHRARVLRLIQLEIVSRTTSLMHEEARLAAARIRVEEARERNGHAEATVHRHEAAVKVVRESLEEWKATYKFVFEALPPLT